MINKLASDNENCMIQQLHGRIFDMYNKHLPETVILPLQEYTQEFHDFIDALHKKINIVVFCESINNDIISYFINNKIKIIQKSDNQSTENILTYSKMYNNNIYKNINANRNDKILVMLSLDNEINKSILEDVLYPKTNHKLCLINNHTFEHPQNIGICNDHDLSYFLNTFSSFVDISNDFELEAIACGIKKIKCDNLLENINTNRYIEYDYNIENYSIDNFVNTKLLSFLGE